MNFYSNLSFKSIAAGLALLALPLGYSQIPDPELDSIFERLKGDDYDARYAARMDLQNAVSNAGAPANHEQIPLVEAQLLEKLESETLLTTRLWILQQLQLIGTEASVDTLESLLISDSPQLVDAAKMTLRALSGEKDIEDAPVLSEKLDELLRAFEESENESLSSAIFAKIASKSPKQASYILAESPHSEYIRIAATSANKRLEKAALEFLYSGDVAQQIVVLSALQGAVSPKIEEQLINLLASENETLTLQVLDALGRVGTARSLDAVLELSDSRNRDISEAAIDTLASISDPRLDRSLFAAAQKGDAAGRAKAVKALSFRASRGVAELVNDLAADSDADPVLREEAIAAMEMIGDSQSLPILVDLVLNGGELRKEAQKTLKRMTLRSTDSDAAWLAFKHGFENADADAKLALLLVSDSAPTPEMVEYLLASYRGGDESIQKTVMRVLPSWRNWDGGAALLTIAKEAGEDSKTRLECFKGIGRLILGGDERLSYEAKFELASNALDMAETEEERRAVLSGVRYVTSREKRYVSGNDFDPDLKAAVANGQTR